MMRCCYPPKFGNSSLQKKHIHFEQPQPKWSRSRRNPPVFWVHIICVTLLFCGCWRMCVTPCEVFTLGLLSSNNNFDIRWRCHCLGPRRSENPQACPSKRRFVSNNYHDGDWDEEWKGTCASNRERCFLLFGQGEIHASQYFENLRHSPSSAGWRSAGGHNCERRGPARAMGEDRLNTGFTYLSQPLQSMPKENPILLF